MDYANKIKSLGQNNDLVNEIKKSCSFAEIRLIIDKFIKLAKTFDDGCNEETVEKYRSSIKIGDAVELGNYLGSARLTKKQSTVDVMSYASEKVTAIEVGQQRVTYYQKEKGQDVECVGGVLGGFTGPQAITQAMSVCAKHVAIGKGHNKKSNFHIENKFAPNPTLITAMSTVSELRGLSATELDRQAQKLMDLSPEDYAIVQTHYNAGVPTIGVEGQEIKVVSLEQVFEEEGEDKIEFRDALGRPPIPVRYDVKGEYTQVAKQMSIYQMGSKFPAIKRLGRNAWVGAPIDNLMADHVIALHDAGVPVDSRILVVSADTNLLTMLRSNFGANVLGVGSGNSQMILPSEIHKWQFDYVYYPKPIVMNATSAFSRACEDVRSKMLKVMAEHSHGQVICHVSPLMFYCKEFCEAFGIETSGRILAMALSQAKDMGVVESNTYLPTDTENYPIVEDRARKEWEDEEVYAAYIKKNPTLYHKLKAIKTYTQLTWGGVAEMKIPATVSSLSQFGTLVYGAKKMLTMSQAIGHTVGYMRDVFKSIWFMGATSPHRYKIRLFVPGAAVENLEFADAYSALYRSEHKRRFEDDDKKAVEQAVVRQEVGEAQAQPKKEVEVRRVRPKKVDISFNDE